MNKKLKAPFIWALIGVILGALNALSGIGQYFLFRADQRGELVNAFINELGINVDAMLLWGLIASIVGLLIIAALVPFLIKITKKPTKNDYIFITAFGALGTFFGLNLGGILILVGGILGITRSK